jgi:hypothetical protein
VMCGAACTPGQYDELGVCKDCPLGYSCLNGTTFAICSKGTYANGACLRGRAALRCCERSRPRWRVAGVTVARCLHYRRNLLMCACARCCCAAAVLLAAA